LKHFPPHGVGGPAKVVVAGNPLLDPRIALGAYFPLIDVSVIGQVNGAKGQIRILFPPEAEAARNRQRRYQPPRPPPIQRLLQRAYELKRRLDTTPGLTRFALAKDLRLDPSRITQILNLLNLAPQIQAYIRKLPLTKCHDPIGDRRWLRTARIQDHNVQIKRLHWLLAQGRKAKNAV
jgi:hypothetical protein